MLYLNVITCIIKCLYCIVCSNIPVKYDSVSYLCERSAMFVLCIIDLNCLIF